MEYLLVMDTEGRALFSKCFGGFCESLFGSSRNYFERFLDMLSKAPTIFGVNDGQHIKYELDRIEIHLAKAGKDMVVCIGLTHGSFREDVPESLLNSIVAVVSQFGYRKLLDEESKFSSIVVELMQHIPHLEGSACPHPSCPLALKKENRSKAWESLRDKYNLNMEVKK